MTSVGESLQHHLIGLLADGPSSFAALYGGLVRHCGYSRGLKVSETMDALQEMKRRGWVKARQMAQDGSFHELSDEQYKRDLIEYEAWLPEAEFEALSLDEVGLWYNLTPEGALELRRWREDQGHTHVSPWMLDDLRDTSTIVIHAKTAQLVEEALRWWLSRNPQIDLGSDSKSIEPAFHFKLRDGTVVASGVKLVCHYRLAPD